MIIAVLAFFMVLSVQQTYAREELGADEIYYYDYALKSPSLGIRIGEQVGPEAMTTAACRGFEVWPHEMIPDCGAPQPNPDQLWQGGYNVTFQHPPAYFTLTSVGAKVLGLLPGVNDTLTAHRLVGVVWLAAGISLLWYALELTRLDAINRVALIVLLGAPPALVYTSASIHAGNAQLVGGAAVLGSRLLWESGRWRWWAVPAASAIAVGLNLNNASAVGALVAYLAYRAWRDQQKRNHLILTAATSLAATVVPVVGWQAWQNHRKLADIDDLPIQQVTTGENGRELRRWP